MIYPEIRHIESPDLQPPNLPEDPLDCAISFQAFIGPREEEGEEAFYFLVVTPTRLARSTEAQWARGMLLVPVFEWAIIVQAVAKLLAGCARPTWKEVATELNKELRWEFDRQTTPDSVPE